MICQEGLYAYAYVQFAFNFQNSLLDFNSETRYILCSVHILFLGKSHRKDNVRCEGQEGILQSHASQRFDTPDETLLEYSLRGIPGLSEIEAEMAELEADLADPAKMKRYGELQTAFEHLGGYDIETRVKVALGGLGFATEEFSKPFASFSGGWRMRAELSRVLASRPDLLLLDEPSNYLDLPRWTGSRSSSRRTTERSC